MTKEWHRSVYSAMSYLLTKTAETSRRNEREKEREREREMESEGWRVRETER